jgi:hypothetical protein
VTLHTFGIKYQENSFKHGENTPRSGKGNDFLNRATNALEIFTRTDSGITSNYKASVQQRKQLPE